MISSIATKKLAISAVIVGFALAATFAPIPYPPTWKPYVGTALWLVVAVLNVYDSPIVRDYSVSSVPVLGGLSDSLLFRSVLAPNHRASPPLQILPRFYRANHGEAFVAAQDHSFSGSFILGTGIWRSRIAVPKSPTVDPYVRSKTNAIRDSRIASIHACSVIVEDATPS